MSTVPELGPHCNSWVVTRKATGEVIGEFYDRRNVELFGPSKCTIETALQYLVRINRKIPIAAAWTVTRNATERHVAILRNGQSPGRDSHSVGAIPTRDHWK